MKNYNFKALETKLSFKKYEELNSYWLPEICFTGRSNVGKSSLINALLNRKGLATTSNKPGHTKKIFLYNIDKKFILVDLPGYGYAQISKKKTQELSELLHIYLTKRDSLKKVFVLIDSRHGFKESDFQFIDFLTAHNIKFRVILTKVDKISKKDVISLNQSFTLNSLIKDNPPFFSSAKVKKGIKEIRKEIINTIS
jgi:GTP-binding protein